MLRTQRFPVSTKNMAVELQAIPCGESKRALLATPSKLPGKPTLPLPAKVDVITEEPAEYEFMLAPEKSSFRTQWFDVSATKRVLLLPACDWPCIFI
jgi:hypothetical protein